MVLRLLGYIADVRFGGDGRRSRPERLSTAPWGSSASPREVAEGFGAMSDLWDVPHVLVIYVELTPCPWMNQ